MQPSSLVFLVIIAIWAAYVTQHWVRHRDHLATARSVDRFSEAMRVLDRRLPLTEAAGPAATPRSYAVSPARPVRPEVAVKSRPSSTPPRAAAPASAGPAGRTNRGMSARRLRGLSFLACLLLVVASPVLAAVGALSWWAVAGSFGLLVADLVVLRRAAQRSRRPGRAAASARRSGTSRPAARARTSRPAQVAPPARRVAATSTTATRVATPAASPAQGDASVAGEAERVGAAVSEPAPALAPPAEIPRRELAPGEWAPVPVPPPTYTLKARAAERPEPVAAAAPAAPAPSAFDGVVEEGELDGLLDRRRAAGA